VDARERPAIRGVRREVNVATRRLFDEDSHRCDFDARIIAMRPEAALIDASGSEATPSGGLTANAGRPGGPWIALDATAFFPEEGGQRADQGDLSGVRVVGLLLDCEGTIWHGMERDPGWTIGEKISGRVDPALRRDHRQQHSGQHILSRIFTERLGAATRSFHMGEDLSTIDIDDGGNLDHPRVLEVENRANAIVMDDLSVTTTEEARPGERPLRTVVIQGIEAQHCCGTHVKRTGEVGLIKILRWEKAKGLTRVYFVCGERALSLFQRLIESVDGAARPFSAGWFDLPRVVAGLIEEGKEADRRARYWQKRWAALEAGRLAASPRLTDGTLRVAAWIDGADAETLRAAAKGILDHGDAIVLLAGEGEPGKRPWVAARTESLPAGRAFDARESLSGILGGLGGRGGGTALFAQGSCPAEETACREALRKIAEAP
jgi:alanyl-tRNA synthetase